MTSDFVKSKKKVAYVLSGWQISVSALVDFSFCKEKEKNLEGTV